LTSSLVVPTPHTNCHAQISSSLSDQSATATKTRLKLETARLQPTHLSSRRAAHLKGGIVTCPKYSSKMFSVLRQEIGWVERLLNDLFCVE